MGLIPRPIGHVAGTPGLMLIGHHVPMAPDDVPFDPNVPVESVQDLVAVVDHLYTDLATYPERWENATLDRFLEAMSGWLSAFPQSYLNTGAEVPAPDWQFVADVLLAARIYE